MSRGKHTHQITFDFSDHLTYFLRRHAKQVAEVEKNGFFVMEDGQRSCDVIVKKKVKRGGEAPPKPPKMRERATQTDLKLTGMSKKGQTGMKDA